MAYTIRPQVLDKIRAEHHWSSDEQMAVNLGLSRGTIDRLRAGGQPSFPVAMRLLEAAKINDIRAATVKIPNPDAA
ncbi:MAG: hypothetical protein L0K27_02620 [Corynebacterium nuruki]|jgi:transcriptional regulator with XRE-family HTH domain|nr:hypothetical protein [Corynebacterium nuruki]